jgi:hypothetical protein
MSTYEFYFFILPSNSPIVVIQKSLYFLHFSHGFPQELIFFFFIETRYISDCWLNENTLFDS